LEAAVKAKMLTITVLPTEKRFVVSFWTFFVKKMF